MTDKSYWPTIDSNTLETVGSRDIGLRCSCIEVGGCVLGTGTTSADFQIGGKWPSRRDALNMVANGSHIIDKDNELLSVIHTETVN